MEGVRKPGAGSLVDSAGGGARPVGVRSADATPGKRTLTMGLDAAQPVPYRAALIASLADGPAIDDATVILVGLRRDPRLE